MPDSISEKKAQPAPTLELLATLYTLDQLKSYVHDKPQIALAGRSNVGKSSLINALARRKKLAKVSSEPGKTRSVNLFEVKPDGFCLTDLPGYGYARRGHEERRSWAELIQLYLEKTPSLRSLALLVDCRIPTQESDRVMADFAKAHGLPIIVVLTKADKCTIKEKSAQQKAWQKFTGTTPIVVSSITKQGIDELWARLREAGKPEEPVMPEEKPEAPAESPADTAE